MALTLGSYVTIESYHNSFSGNSNISDVSTLIGVYDSIGDNSFKAMDQLSLIKNITRSTSLESLNIDVIKYLNYNTRNAYKVLGFDKSGDVSMETFNNRITKHQAIVSLEGVGDMIKKGLQGILNFIKKIYNTLADWSRKAYSKIKGLFGKRADELEADEEALEGAPDAADGTKVPMELDKSNFKVDVIMADGKPGKVSVDCKFSRLLKRGAANLFNKHQALLSNIDGAVTFVDIPNLVTNGLNPLVSICSSLKDVVKFGKSINESLIKDDSIISKVTDVMTRYLSSNGLHVLVLDASGYVISEVDIPQYVNAIVAGKKSSVVAEGSVVFSLTKCNYIKAENSDRAQLTVVKKALLVKNGELAKNNYSKCSEILASSINEVGGISSTINKLVDALSKEEYAKVRGGAMAVKALGSFIMTAAHCNVKMNEKLFSYAHAYTTACESFYKSAKKSAKSE